MAKYELRTTGQVSINPCKNIEVVSWKVLIMGPTGAGKSAFIEALAGAGQSLGISKDQLTGVTQDVSSYQLINATFKFTYGECPIYVIDTPGFSDSKISEMEIVNKVKTWMAEQKIAFIDSIIYLYPISDTRVPGSKRRTIRMIQSLLKEGSAPGFIISTTMWDRISNPQARERAEANFVQLQDDIWKELVNCGAQITVFQNDYKSAIDIIEIAIQADLHNYPFLNDRLTFYTPSAQFLYQELIDRVNLSRQEIESLQLEHMQLIIMPDPELDSVVVPRLQEVKQDLAKFLGQLVAFGAPPPAFEKAPAQLVSQHLLDQVNSAQQYLAVFKNTLAQLPKLDLVRRTNTKAAIRKIEARLGQLSKYLDESGKPVLPSGYDGLADVLKFLRPNVTLTQHMKEGINALTQKFKSH